MRKALPAVLSETTDQIIRMLTNDVRVIATHQLAEYIFASGKEPLKAAQKLCRKLEAEGLVTRSHTTATFISVAKPLLQVNPTEQHEEPNWGKLGYQNQLRWKIPTKPTTIIQATPKAHGLFGGEPRTSRQHEVEHDLGVSSYYFHLLWVSPELATSWQGEDSIDTSRFDGHRPDAIVVSKGAETVLDVLGRGYDAARIRNLVRHFHNHSLELR